MIMKMIYFSIIMFMMIILFAFSKYHIMNNLIILEFIVVSMSASMLLMMKCLETENFTILFIMIIMIMESVLGLSLLINMIRTHSNDYVKSISMSKF
uniref:NADH dehydrogenase subunit 4L n=1 Tax=Vasdavidius concursus TaxID=290153 RepID=Q5URP9_9HEMI|nr:NADH dehydrogenase subunit 4L [Vasdavidius concursus]